MELHRRIVRTQVSRMSSDVGQVAIHASVSFRILHNQRLDARPTTQREIVSNVVTLDKLHDNTGGSCGRGGSKKSFSKTQP